MLPILHSGDVVFYWKTAFTKLKINDIVLVQKNKKLFTHRIIYKTKQYLVTKGDNNPESDGKIYPNQIIGKVVKVKRNGKELDPNQIYLLQSSLYFQEILKIKSLFEKRNIDFVYLKGLPLHLFYEKAHPQRIYADCDILISSKAKNMGEKILLMRGYKKVDSNFSDIQTKLQDREIEISFYKIINGFYVVFDIHYEVSFLIVHLGKLEALYPQKLIDKLTKDCLKTRRQIKINGESFPILNTKYLILYLALHFFHHNFQGAFRLEFLDKVMEKSKLDSDLINQLIDIVKTYRLQSFVYPTFVLLKKYYQTPIPQGFLAKIKPRNSLTLKLVNSLISTNIFDDEPRIGAGIRRFKNLFILSPEPLWWKVMIVFNPQVLYTAIWLFWNKIGQIIFSNKK